MAYSIEALKSKQEEFRQAWALAKEIHAKAETAKRDFTTEEQQSWNTANADINRLEAEIDRMLKENERDKKTQEWDQKFAQPVDKAVPDSTALSTATQEPTSIYARKEYSDAFSAFLRTGDEQALKRELWTTMQVDSPLYGGYLVASESFINEVIKNADQANVIAGMIRSFPVNYEETLGAPAIDTDITNFSFAGETTDAEEDQLKIGRRELKPRPLKPKVVKLSKFLLESPRFDTEALVGERLGIALGRTFEYYYQLGSGANQPLGLFTASDDGIPTSQDISTGNLATSPTFDGLINAQGKLPDAYDGTAKWLFHRDAITKIRLLKQGTSEYIWTQGNVTAGIPNLILGMPYVTSQYCPHTFTTGLYVGMLADFSHYWAAVTANGLRIQRLVELYSISGQVGLLTDRLGVDGMPVLAEAFVRVKLG